MTPNAYGADAGWPSMRALVPAVALLVLLAGCFDSKDPPATAPSDTTPTPGDDAGNATYNPPTPGVPSVPVQDHLLYEDCQSQWGLFPLPKSEAQSHLPTGFQPSQWSTDRTGSMGTAIILATHCENLSGGGLDRSGGIDEFWAFMGVLPPEELRCQPACGSYWIPVGMFATDQQLVDLYASWHMGQARVSEVRQSIDGPLPFLAVGEATATAGGDGVTFQNVMAGAQGASTSIGLHIRFFGVEASQVTNIIDMHWQTHVRASGYGVYQFEGESTFWDPLTKPAAFGNAYHIIGVDPVPFHFNLTRSAWP